jgi:hypothetical protein
VLLGSGAVAAALGGAVAMALGGAEGVRMLAGAAVILVSSVVLVTVGHRAFVRSRVALSAGPDGMEVTRRAEAWGGERRTLVPWADLPTPAFLATDRGVVGLELRLPGQPAAFVPAAAVPARDFTAFADAVRRHWPGAEDALRRRSLDATAAHLRRRARDRIARAIAPAVALLPAVFTWSALGPVLQAATAAFAVAAGLAIAVGIGGVVRGSGEGPRFPADGDPPHRLPPSP